MKLRHFHILLILLFALALCPILGGYCGAEGLTNIDEHLSNDHGISTAGSNSATSQNEGNSHDHEALTERLNTLEQTLRTKNTNNNSSSNSAVGNNAQGAGNNAQGAGNNAAIGGNSQGAGSTALENVGGNMRSMGALENNKIPEHQHSGEEKCPACPPCGRCPEASFSCKKVPNYSSGNKDHLPRPVLTNFSSFGM
jgi:hypothetical protein